MAKKIKTVVKLQIPAGKATPAPPIGPALGQHGVNIGEFVSKFNEATREKGGGHYSRGNKRLRRPNIFVQNENPAGFGLVEKGRRRGKRFRKNSGEQSGEDN